jgi:diphthamide biosynthesis protein 3
LNGRVTKLEIAAMLYTPETLAALERYRAHLRELRGRLDERGIVAKEELKKYGDVGEFEGEEGSGSDAGTLAEIARRYGGLLREVENVRMEIARIGE